VPYPLVIWTPVADQCTLPQIARPITDFDHEVTPMVTRKFCAGSLGFLLLTLLLVAIGCSSKKPAASKQESTSSSDESCLLGKWVATEGGMEKSFTFNPDKTGTEVQSPTDIRPLNWSQRGKKLHIVYPAHGDSIKTEWDIDYRCSRNELSVLGLTYKKE
jgi:hypothetical protein